MPYKTVLYDREDFAEGSVATITFNKPDKLNAMDVELTEDIMAALNEAENDDDVKCVVFKGAGRGFSAGYDLSRAYFVYGAGSGKAEEKARRPSQRVRFRYDRWRSETLRRVFTFPKVTIAQVHGPCIGGGLYVSLCCDITIAADNAQIGHSEQRLGFSGTMYIMPVEIALIGQKKTRELLLTGRLLDGKEAERIGLVNKSVPEEELEAETRRFAQGMTLLPRDGIAIGKAFAQLAYDGMGISSAFTQGFIGHSFYTNVRFEEGEWNFVKARRDVGTRGAFNQRDERWAKLGF